MSQISDSAGGRYDEDPPVAKRRIHPAVLPALSFVALIAVGAAVISFVNSQSIGSEGSVDAAQAPQMLSDLGDGWKTYRLPDLKVKLEIPGHPTQSSLSGETFENVKDTTYYYMRTGDVRFDLMGFWYKTAPPTLQEFVNWRIAAMKSNSSYKNVVATTKDGDIDGVPAKLVSISYDTYGVKYMCENCYVCSSDKACIALEAVFTSRQGKALSQIDRIHKSFHFDKPKQNS